MDISKDSVYKNEEELLLKPYTYFRVLEQETEIFQNKEIKICPIQVEGTALNISGIWSRKEDDGEYFVSQ